HIVSSKYFRVFALRSPHGGCVCPLRSLKTGGTKIFISFKVGLTKNYRQNKFFLGLLTGQTKARTPLQSAKTRLQHIILTITSAKWIFLGLLTTTTKTHQRRDGLRTEEELPFFSGTFKTMTMTWIPQQTNLRHYVDTGRYTERKSLK